jgi:hypothetical protein
MADQGIQVSFPNCSPARAEDLARRLTQALSEELPEEAHVTRIRASADSMNEGEIVSVLLGAASDTSWHHFAVFAGTLAGTALCKSVEQFAEKHKVVARISSVFWPQSHDLGPSGEKGKTEV